MQPGPKNTCGERQVGASIPGKCAHSWVGPGRARQPCSTCWQGGRRRGSLRVRSSSTEKPACHLPSFAHTSLKITCTSVALPSERHYTLPLCSGLRKG